MVNKLVLITFLTLFLGEITFAGGFQLNECGARSMAQAGAFAARANDPSALYFNPAGISYLKGTQAYLGLTLVSPQMKFRGPTNFNTNVETELESKMYTPINFYATYEINDFLAAGFAVSNPFGLGTKWPDNWVGKSLSIKSEVQVFNFNPNISVKLLNDMVAIAAGFDYSIGTVEIKKEASNFSPTAIVELKTKSMTDGHGAGYNFGVMIRPSNDFSFGASYRSQIQFDIEGTATFTPKRDVFPEGDVSTSMKLPANAFIGVAYSPMSDLWLEFDAQFIGWSSYDKLEITFKKDNSVSSTNKNYKDTWIFRIGGEYKLNDMFMLRAGYLHDISPAPDETLDPMLPDSDRNGFTIGVGFKLNDMIHFDLAYFYLPFNQRTTNTQELGLNGTYNTITNLVGFNMGFNF
jgi:long-chain fatty acid transport protein